MDEALILLGLRDALVLLKPTSSVMGETELDSLSMPRPCYQCFKGSLLDMLSKKLR